MTLRLLRRLLLGFALLSAGAGTAAAQENGPFRVRQDRYVLLAGGQGVGEERIVVPGDAFMRTRIGYAAAARPAAPVSLILAGVPIDVPADSPLPEVRALGDTRARLGRDARIFCGTQRRPDSIAAPPAGPHPRGRRFEDHVSPCFVDKDRDGRLESAFLVGTKWSSERVLVPMPPVAYAELRDIALPASEAWISFEKGGLLQGPVLELHARFFGNPMGIRAVRLGAERKFFPAERTVRREAYPHVIKFGAAEISVLGYEPDGRRLRIRVDRAFETAALDFEFIQHVHYIYIYR